MARSKRNSRQDAVATNVHFAVVAEYASDLTERLVRFTLDKGIEGRVSASDIYKMAECASAIARAISVAAADLHDAEQEANELNVAGHEAGRDALAGA